MYSGDSFYNGSTHTGNVAGECFTTVKQPSTPTTASSPTGGNVVPGTSVTDTATITGAAGQPTPTGTVTFFLCQPRGERIARRAGRRWGRAVVLERGGDVVRGDGGDDAERSGDRAVLLAGGVLGRQPYNGSTHTGNVAGECFTTVKQPSTPTTASSPTGSNVVPGTSVTDTATITGGAGQPTPTGTVTFFLCQPGDGDGGGVCCRRAGPRWGRRWC